MSLNVHCKACLASLLPSFTWHFMSDGNEYKEMSVLSDLQVEYPHFILFVVKIRIVIFFSCV